ncbi:MAG: DeoR family transcriptional regulator [Streptosporangiales bacterium]|nr:DeoR family transcriptional regulator [Streptosporangiales bacterium]
MIAAQRRNGILELVRSNGAVSLRELAQVFGTSVVTIRRDLQALESESLLDRRHGGAVANGPHAQEPTYFQKSRTASAEKTAIAELASSLIEEGDALVIGAGTTTQALARRLARYRELTIVTNSLLVAEALARSRGVDVAMTGGTLRGSIFALVGGVTEQTLAGIRTRRAFLSGNGLTAERGLSTPNMLVASVDRAIAKAADEVVVLADHTKLGADTMIQTVATDRITHLVTDDGAPATIVDALRDAGVTVHVAATS